jgi:RDD family
MPASGLKAAPLWRRLAALVIDAAVFLTPTIGGGAGAALLYMKWKGRDDPELDWSPPKLSRRWQLVLAGLSVAIEVPSRNWRSPGYRALGLRCVDVRTGGPVSIQSAVIRSLAAQAFSQSTRTLLRPWDERRRERLVAAHAELEELRRAHPRDREAMKGEVRNVFERHDVSPAHSCLLPLAAVVPPNLSAAFSPLHQTPWERLAGIVVVED